jgi:hypothetical protein
MICPHCERVLDVAHDADACRRRMSRRFFFAAITAPLVASIAAKIPPPRRPIPWKTGTMDEVMRYNVGATAWERGSREIQYRDLGTLGPSGMFLWNPALKSRRS